MRGRGRALRAEAVTLRIAERPPHPASPRAAGRGEVSARALLFSRHVLVPEPCQPPRQEKDLPPATTRDPEKWCPGFRTRSRADKREAKRRKAHANHWPRTINKRCRLLMIGAAARSFGARPPSGASTAVLAGTPIPAQLQAMFPGTWNQAGITRPLLSQSSDSTSRLGRNTEGPDARSRSGAVCEAARKHRTRTSDRIRNASLE